MAGDSTDRREVFVKIDGDKEPTNSNATANGNNPISRGSSYSFWTDDKSGKNNQKGGDESYDFTRGAESKEADPPSKLIGRFLHQQKASGEISLDMDLGMAELQSQPPSRAVTTVSETATPGTGTHRVTFEENVDGNPDSIRRRQRDSRSPHSKDDADSSDEDKDNDGGGEVVKCTSNKTFQRNPSLMRTKTKSRLFDLPPTPPAPAGATDKKSGRIPRSGLLKSGLFGKSPGQHSGAREEEEEEDPFLDEDLPENYMKDQLSIWILLEWVSLISIITGLICSLTIPHLKSKNLWDLPLWKWELMVLVLICGRLVSSWIVRIVVFCIERNFLLRKRVLYFVYGVRKAVQNFLWLGLVLIAWHFLFDKKVERDTRSRELRLFTRILVCLLVGFVVWLIKTLLVKVLASSFHMSTYFDRIHDSLFNQYVIETLSGPPVVEIQRTEEEEERIANEVKSLQKAGVKIPPGLKAATCPSPHQKKPIGSGVLPQKSPRIGKSPVLSRASSSKKRDDKGITIDHLHRLNTKNVSAWRMKRLMNIIRNGALSTLDEQIQDSAIEDDENAKQIQSEYEAKVAARKIFHNVAKPGSRYIYSEDIMRFMHEDEAFKTMTLFEGVSDNHRISKSSLKNWVVNAFRERRALALTLNDTKTAVNRLNHIVNILVGIIIFIICLLILGIATSKFLLFVSSQLVLVAFIFGNSCKTVFEAIIFLFVMHPFDVGDRCEIDGIQMVVEEMNILTTVFLRYDNQKIIYPNSLLATKAISNYYRSPDMGDAVEFWIHISTPPDKVAAIKQRIVSYIENRKDHWYPSPMIVFRDMEGLNSVKMAVWPTHRMNHQDMGERFVRRGHLIEEIARICRELDIQFRLFPLDINVRSLPAPNVMPERVPPSWKPRGT